MPPIFVVVMGVSGCGKTTVAESVALAIGADFLEGDAFHSPSNKTKMAAGIPLDDDDRWSWFDSLVVEAQKSLSAGKSAVLACSALKARYREHLFRKFPNHRLVFLKGSYEVIKNRMDAREHEYMTSTLLRSQFESLEEPAGDASCLVLSVNQSPESIVSEVVVWLRGD